VDGVVTSLPAKTSWVCSSLSCSSRRSGPILCSSSIRCFARQFANLACTAPDALHLQVMLYFQGLCLPPSLVLPFLCTRVFTAPHTLHSVPALLFPCAQVLLPLTNFTLALLLCTRRSLFSALFTFPNEFRMLSKERPSGM